MEGDKGGGNFPQNTPQNHNSYTKINPSPPLSGVGARGTPVQNRTIVQVVIDNQWVTRTIFVRKPVQKRTIMYKNEPIFDVEYEEVGSQSPKNSLFGLHIPPVAYIIKREVLNFKIHPVAKAGGRIVAMILIKSMSVTGHIIWFVLTVVYYILEGLFLGLCDVLRDIFETRHRTTYKTPFETHHETGFKTPVETDWRDIPTGQNRTPAKTMRQSHKKGGNTYINIIHNY